MVNPECGHKSRKLMYRLLTCFKHPGFDMSEREWNIFYKRAGSAGSVLRPQRADHAQLPRPRDGASSRPRRDAGGTLQRGLPRRAARVLHGDRKGTNGVSTNGVTANFIFVGRGTFGVLPLTYFYIFPNDRAYLSPNLSKYTIFAAAPLVLTLFVRNQGDVRAGAGSGEGSLSGERHAGRLCLLVIGGTMCI